MEGQLYRCSWRHSGGEYHLWVTGRPRISGSGSSLDEAIEALSTAICDATGDGESLHDFNPPLPTFQYPGLVARLRTITYRGTVGIANPYELFAQPDCPQCGSPRGERTTKPLRLRKVPAHTHVSLARTLPYRGPELLVLSEEFLDLLTRSERSHLTLRQVELHRQGSRRLYELLATRPTLPYASLSRRIHKLWSLPRHQAAGTYWRCDTCHRQTQPFYLFWEGRHLPSRFLRHTDLPRPLPPLFAVGEGPAHLCLTPRRWQALHRSLRTLGIPTTEVGVLAAGLAGRLERRLHSTVHEPGVPSVFRLGAAADWAWSARLSEEPSEYFPLLRGTLASAEQRPRDRKLAIEALAAAEVIADLHGRPLPGLYPPVHDWLTRYITRAPLPQGLLGAAARTVRRLRRRTGLHRDPIDGGLTPPEWAQYLHGLLLRLRP